MHAFSQKPLGGLGSKAFVKVAKYVVCLHMRQAWLVNSSKDVTLNLYILIRHHCAEAKVSHGTTIHSHYSNKSMTLWAPPSMETAASKQKDVRTEDASQPFLLRLPTELLF